MSLVVFREKSAIPENIKYIECNDEFFNYHTSIPDTEFGRKILKEVEGATYNSDITFVGRNKELGALNRELLCTGTKTLLDVLQHPDGYCFNVIECGENAMKILAQMNSGNVLWEEPYFFCDNFECDIEYNGEKFSRIYEFLDRVEDEDGGSLDD